MRHDVILTFQNINLYLTTEISVSIESIVKELGLVQGKVRA